MLVSNQCTSMEENKVWVYLYTIHLIFRMQLVQNMVVR